MLARSALLLALLAVTIAVENVGAQSAPQTPQDEIRRWEVQLQDPAPSYRAQAAYEISKLGQYHATTIQSLYRRLSDFDPRVRLETIHALGTIGAQPAVTAEQLLPLLSDEDEHVRYAAEWALARLAVLPTDPETAGTLHDLFAQAVSIVRRRSHHERHRQVIEEALGRLRSSLPKMRLATHPDQERVPTSELFENQSRVEAIYQAFEAGQQLARLKIIDQIPNGNASDIPELQIRVLRRALMSSDFFSVHFALHRWGESGRAAVWNLFDSLPPNATVPEWATDLIYEISPRHLADVVKLGRFANNTNNSALLRLASVQALGRSTVDPPRCADALLRLFADSNEDEYFRADILRALGSLAGREGDSSSSGSWPILVERTRSTLLSVLQSPEQSWFLRTTAARALSGLADTSTPSETLAAANAFVDAAQAYGPADYELRTVVEILSSFGATTTSGSQLITEALLSQDDLTRIAGAEAVQKLGTKAEIPTVLLISRLDDPGETAAVQLAVIRALAALGPDAIRDFARTLTYKPHPAQISGLNALSNLGPASAPALSACVDILCDERSLPEVQCVAAATLGEMGTAGRQAGESLKCLAEETRMPAIRATAIVALAKLEALNESTLSLGREDNLPASQVAVAYANYRMGDSGGIPTLVSMLDHPEHHAVAHAALVEIGEQAKPKLLHALHNRSASQQQRLRALEVLIRLPHESYLPLLSAVEDPTIAVEGERHLSDLFLTGGTQLLSDLVASMQSNRSPAAIKHYEAMTETLTSGVGAGGEDEVLQNASALVLHFKAGLTTEADDVASEIASTETPPVTSQFPDVQPEVHEDPFPTFPNTAEIAGPSNTLRSEGGNTQQYVTTDSQDPSATVAEEENQEVESELLESDLVPPWSPTAAPSIAGSPRPFPVPLSSESEVRATTERELKSVKVFYGTNRDRAETGMSLVPATSTRANQKLLAILASVSVIAVCLFGFFRQRSIPYSLFAVIGLATVAWFGFRAQVTQQPITRPAAKNLAYSSEYTNQVKLGVCEVTLPKNHTPGELESPSILRFEFRQDPERHVVLQRTEELDSDEFFNALEGELDARGKSLLVFVHGYNVTFEDAARRTAQMAHDLDYPGAPVLYSWPSQANWYQYQLDKKNIELSVNHIRQFIVRLAEQSGAETVNLVAHSMGSVGLTAALAEIESSQPMFNQVVLAAPDIDADIFRTRIAPRIEGKADRFTLYTSSADFALVASRYFNSGRRVGESEQPFPSFPGMEIIDASAADTSLLGHSYYGGSVSVLQDLGELLQDRPIQERTFLRSAMSRDGRPYWLVENPYFAERPDSGEVVR